MGGLLLFFVMGTTGCQEKSAANALVIGLPADVVSLNPLMSTSSIDYDVQKQLFLRLMEEKPHFDGFVPELAKSWDFSRDGKVITFHLRSRIMWSDGVPLTSRDVVFTHRAETNPKLGWIFQSEKTQIDSVVAPNDSTVRFYFARRYPDQLTDANEGFILPEHILGGLSAEAWQKSRFNRFPVTAGAYLLLKWVSQQSIQLVANPTYFRTGFPKIRHVIFKIVPDESVRLSQILNGEIDILEGISVRRVARLRKRPNISIEHFSDMAYGFLGWNLRNPLFRSGRVRQALTLAIDRKSIVDNVFGGFARVCDSPILPQSWAYCDTIRPFPFNPERARKILTELGWHDSDGDGFLEKNGKPFRFELMTNFGNPTRRDLAVLIQAQLKKIGVDAQIQMYDWSIFLDRFKSGDYDAVLSAWRLSSKLELRSFWHSESIRNGFNRFFYRNPEVDALINRVEDLENPAQAKPLWWKLQSLIYRDQPVTFLYIPDRVIAYRNRLARPEFHPLSTYFYLYKWHWKSEQKASL